jgi:Family of unknown function (DUF6166)
VADRTGTSPEGTRAPWQGKTYVGHAGATPTDGSVLVLTDDQAGPLAFVDQAEHARRYYGETAVAHPPGWGWGYQGGAPADTAASILADHFGVPQPRSVLQRFKGDVIARLPQGRGWTLTGAQVQAWAEANQGKLDAAWRRVWAYEDELAGLAAEEAP